MSKNLVMGVAKGYGWYDLEPFINSFAKNCRSAELVLFVDDLSDFTLDKMIRYGVKIEAFTAKNTPVNARWKFFLNYLQAHEGEYEQVFLSDVRDVIFQSDVFECFKGLSNWLGCVTEADDIAGSKTGINKNYHWLTEFFGKEEADKLADRKIICAGTVIGSIEAMKIFLSQMSARLNDKTLWGHDQATLNYLAYNGLFPIENLFEIDVYDGAIFTSGLTVDKKIRDGFILRGDGGIPAAVHQYDGSYEFICLVDMIYRAGDFQFDARFIDRRSLLEQCCCLLHVGKIPEATRLFLKIFFSTTNLGGFTNLLIEIWKIASRKNFTRSVEIIELTVQNALYSVGLAELSIKQWENVQKILVYAINNNHAVDNKLKFSFANLLFETVKAALEMHSAEACFLCIDWLNQLEMPPDEKFQRLVAEVNRKFGRNR